MSGLQVGLARTCDILCASHAQPETAAAPPSDDWPDALPAAHAWVRHMISHSTQMFLWCLTDAVAGCA